MSVWRRVLGWPLRTGVDHRLGRLAVDIDQRTAGAGAQRLQALLGQLDQRFEAAGLRLHNEVHGLDQRLDQRFHELIAQLTADGPGGRNAVETLAAIQRALISLHDQLDRLMPSDHAAANRALGVDGPAWRAGLAFTQPVAVSFGGDGPQVDDVNERILEVPYVLAALASVEPPARIVDLGGAFSTLALSLASLGHRVTVVDPLGYRLAHPNLNAIGAGFGEVPDDVTGFDVAIAVSSVEHFGLGHYVPPEGRDGVDREALAWLRGRVRAGGTLLLTVPMGEPHVEQGFQRVYDAAAVRALLEGWEIEEFRAGWATERHAWSIGLPDAPRSSRGVALVTARRPAAS